MELSEARAQVSLLCAAAGLPAPSFEPGFVASENLELFPREIFDCLWLLCDPYPQVDKREVDKVIKYLAQVILDNQKRTTPDG